LVFVAIDRARGAIQATIKHDAVCTVEPAVMGYPHVPFHAANAHLATFKMARLASIETTAPDAFGNALLLVGAALVDG
jgi:hypothetical protein